jgi:hypothetical protein
LQEFVNQEGMVNYRDLKANPQKLQDLGQDLAQVRPEDYQGGEPWKDPKGVWEWALLFLVALFLLGPTQFP